MGSPLGRVLPKIFMVKPETTVLPDLVTLKIKYHYGKDLLTIRIALLDQNTCITYY